LLLYEDVQLRPEALRFVLAQGLPAVIEVSGDSMTPSLENGVKLHVEPVAGADGVQVGDIVLMAADGDGDSDSDGDGGGGQPALLLHRVMHLFWQVGRRYVIHQGDAPRSSFAVFPCEAILGRATAVASDPGTPLPTVARMGAADRARFHRRRRACALYAAARRLTALLGIEDRALTRGCARLFRAAARAVAG
jgi:hypothetical protein